MRRVGDSWLLAMTTSPICRDLAVADSLDGIDGIEVNSVRRDLQCGLSHVILQSALSREDMVSCVGDVLMTQYRIKEISFSRRKN